MSPATTPAPAKRGRGRPLGSGTGIRKKSVNVTLDPEAAEGLRRVADAMSGELGFALTLTQTVHRLIKCYTAAKR